MGYTSKTLFSNKQDAILLMNGKNNDNAKLFLKFLSTDLIKQKIKDLGYEFD